KAGRRSVYELQITDARGRRKTLRITATPRFDREGNYRGAFGVFTDITEKKFREEELENFSSTVAHDLSGSLAVVEGFSLAAERAAEEGDRETERESLQNLREAVSRMQRFVESLLEYAKAGRPGGNAERIRLEDMVREVEDELLPVLRERNIKLRTVPTDRDAWVDPVRLRQVLLNLVNNAVSHMGDVPEPEVVVGSRVRKNTMVVYVRDNGVGIPADLQEGIFEPFRKGGSGGSGLGLAIVKRAVESWGGRVWLDSAPGRGTTFFFTVPLAPAAASS
ncbi:MAG: ATP-binding protein, partial [Candidatus Geothermincolales bacterium]